MALFNKCCYICTQNYLTLSLSNSYFIQILTKAKFDYQKLNDIRCCNLYIYNNEKIYNFSFFSIVWNCCYAALHISNSIWKINKKWQTHALEAS